MHIPAPTPDDGQDASKSWPELLQAARQARLAGDVLTLADETTLPTAAAQARRLAGRLLLDDGQPHAALVQLEHALQLDSGGRESHELAAQCRQRIAAGTVDAPSQPKQVLLFSGHRIDEPGRPEPRFDPDLLPAATRRINDELDDLQASTDDRALCQAAAGGDLLFLEACLSRGVSCQVLLPFGEPTFIERSILASIDGQSWLDRWLAIRPALHSVREMAASLGPGPLGSDPYERCNRWLLNTALAYGAPKLRLLCLWNGMDGDGPGGVAHMIDEACRLAGVVRWIDTRSLH